MNSASPKVLGPTGGSLSGGLGTGPVIEFHVPECKEKRVSRTSRAAAVVTFVVGALASCAALEIHRERFARTYEEAPRAYFEGLSAAETGSALADWCSSGNRGWNLDAQSEDEAVEAVPWERLLHTQQVQEEVACSRGKSFTRDFREQVTFALVEAPQGGTCVIGAPTVDNPTNEGGGPTSGSAGPVSFTFQPSIGGGRAMGSRDDWELILAELGGIVPVDEEVCGPAPGKIPHQTIATGETTTLDVASYLTDLDVGALTYAAASSDEGVVSVSVSGGTLTLVGVADGTAEVTVTAHDPDGLLAATHVVWVAVRETSKLAGGGG